MFKNPLSDAALDQIFREARTYRGSARAWLDAPVADADLKAIYDLAKMGPTSANCSPARIVFIRTPEGKEKLRQALDEGNVEQTMAAPVTALVGSDHAFYEHMDTLFPNTGARSWFEGKPEVIRNTAFRNASLQGAYLIVAARALGFDCGPMSGFDTAKADELFFTGTQVKSNFLINIGRGNPAAPKPRNPRFDFDEVCRIA
ncbi:malonic semialdehyde reductase [Tahibacter amnicola]|uniref:Putative NADH dehydrogenase/NAD(P)H nitroreductase N4264_04475 n=1 Tax=Tahibacter amnicola TaxID=2976241 RepID=A0ABY6BKT6_9GAMM|nr:malonic semialdehyde reductase [Tahibacter amnicola]UXI70628.1 malonic semialdehyde reductase [Tahibacter amnicola]